MDWVILIGLCLLLYLGIAWHHAYTWRRWSRQKRKEHYADHVAFNARCPELATPVTPVEEDDGRDGLRAVVDAPRVLWRAVKVLIPRPRDQYKPSPRCVTCNICIVDPGECYSCAKKSAEA
jgi:hypothetical protein